MISRVELYLRLKSFMAKAINFEVMHRLKSRNLKLRPQNIDGRSFIFIHIPKNGGSSISQALFRNFKEGHSHYKMSDYFSCMDRASFESSIKFAVTRNPWDRIYSAYRYLHSPPAWVGANTRQFSQQYINGKSFAEVVSSLEDRPFLRQWTHFQEQYKYITLNDSVELDHILRYENLDDDFQRFCKSFSIEKTSLPRVNATSKPDYRTVYDTSLIDIVSRIYSRDIDEFDYRFE